jgi:hypothetical protein
MKKCKAFNPVAGSRTAWLPCARKAQPGSAFCKKHNDAITGALLGAFTYSEPVEAIEHLCDEANPCSIAIAQRRSNASHKSHLDNRIDVSESGSVLRSRAR